MATGARYRGGNIVTSISYLSELLGSVFARQNSKDNPVDERTLEELSEAILSHQGESSGNRLARYLFYKFNAASEQEHLEFFLYLATDLDIDAKKAVEAAKHYAEHSDAHTFTVLMKTTTSKRQVLFRRLNRLPGATNELVRMRALLLKACKSNPELKRIDIDLQHLFGLWFNRGFLVLREIDWTTPANILEKIIAYEAVHAINTWDALRARLEPVDRRCFAFFHPTMLDEPLIFVEVALTIDKPQSIEQILEGNRSIVDEVDARTAVFYSISNCQKGLAGVSFGNFLIKQVASELAASVPTLNTFRTLSPVPGFMRWVEAEVEIRNKARNQVFENDDPTQAIPGFSLTTLKIAQHVADTDDYDLSDDEHKELRKLVAHYLTQVRRKDRHASDPVAKFHLGNGASLDAVLTAADLKGNGRQQSAGVMVSYLYDLDKVANNHELYADEKQIMASDEVNALLEPERRRRKLA